MGYRITFVPVDVPAAFTPSEAERMAAQMISADPDLYLEECEKIKEAANGLHS